MLLANDTLGPGFTAYQTMVNTVDLQTSVDRLRMQAATRQGHSADFPFPYDISIRESDNLIVDAVACQLLLVYNYLHGKWGFFLSNNNCSKKCVLR